MVTNNRLLRTARDIIQFNPHANTLSVQYNVNDINIAGMDNNLRNELIDAIEEIARALGYLRERFGARNDEPFQFIYLD